MLHVTLSCFCWQSKNVTCSLMGGIGKMLHKEAFGRACIYPVDLAQNPGFRHLEKGI